MLEQFTLKLFKEGSRHDKQNQKLIDLLSDT